MVLGKDVKDSASQTTSSGYLIDISKFYSSTYIVLFAFLFIVCAQAALADSPLAVLRSERNQSAYSDQHIGEFDEDWGHFQHTFETANVRYDLLHDADLSISNLQKLKGYKVIVLPLLVDISADAVSVLKNYVQNGGKLIMTDGCGTPTKNAQAIIEVTGGHVNGHKTSQVASKLVWPRQPFPLEQDFSVGTLSADLQATSSQDSIAHWTGSTADDGSAILANSGNFYIGWAPGMQGELSGNAQIISTVLEESSPGITQEAAVQISYADYQTIKQELQYLEKRTDEIIKTAKQADISVPFSAIQQNYDSALAHEVNFEKAYKERRFLEADQEVQKARHELALAFAKSMPVRPVEQRSVWLDRGTIIANQSPEAMTNLLEKMKASGINAIYFETNNAGFCMFPSKYYPQNPQLMNGADVFAHALKEAHRLGMEFHSWIWVFNVGNERHNPIIGKETDYPGPILSSHKFSWALAGKTGSLLGQNQHEYWLDPAQSDTRQFIKDLAAEICTKYPEVDGLQYDYIRYPFNMNPNEMGWDWAGRLRFERETGLSLDSLDLETRSVWQAWRVAQVNSFVQETTNMLRKLRPGLRISAAVYGYPRRLRCGNIQQDWETWVASGWLDTVNPMTYKEDNKEFYTIANNCREYSEDKALVFPGISIRQLDTAGFIEQLDSSRAIGSLGTTFFAAAQLDDKKLELLKIGPYRRQAVMTPQADPIRATTLLVDDFVSTVNRYMQDPTKRVISDTASTNEVIQEIDRMQKQAHSLTAQAAPADIDGVKKQVIHLHSLIKDWLRIDAFAQRGFRAQYIISYLGQIESILTYASHKATTQGHGGIASSNSRNI